MSKIIPTIKVNMDNKCKRCGEGGTCQNGLCLKCIAKQMTDQNLPVVGEKVLAEILNQITGLFETYEDTIDKAIKKNNGQLDVAFTAKMQSYANNQVGIQTAISFTAEKIKDFSEKAMISESQGELEI